MSQPAQSATVVSDSSESASAPDIGLLTGKVALVTGASRGIGAAAARCLHRDGAEVVVHYGSDRASAEGLRDSLGERVHLVQGNLFDPSAPSQVWREAVEVTGRVDVLVNNAGAWLASPIESAEEWRAAWGKNMTLNLAAAGELCRLSLVHFEGVGGGSIINVVSRSAHRGDDRHHLAYGAAKGGLLALTKGIARGFGSSGVLAYAVAPGWVATDLAADELDPAYLATLPLGEATPAQEVGETIAFLASGRARHLTGATLDITGADYVR